jgi:hypothetical protein
VGEGFVLEVLSRTRALVYWFTYDREGRQRWMIGVGDIEGSRILFDELLTTSGGRFGTDFDPQDVINTTWGTLEFEFTSCDNATATYAGPPDFGTGSLNLQRRSRIFGEDCHGANSAPIGTGIDSLNAGFSGSWYDRSHDGEGFTIEILDEQSALIYWFTYDQEGNQAWMLMEAQIEGATIHAGDVQITSGGRFGANFDPADVVLERWGEATFTLEQCRNQSGRFAGRMSYVPPSDFGAEGTQSLDRLSRIDGVECDLPPGLTGWWPGDGHSNDIVAGRNAALRGDTGFRPGIKHSAFNLDGRGDSIEVPDTAALNFGTYDFTVDLWARFDDLAGEQVLVEKWVQGTPGASIGWTLTKLEGVNVIRLALASRGSREIDIDSPELPLSVHTWHFFVARRIGNEFSTFLDGVPVAGLAVDGGIDLAAPASLKFGVRGTPDERGFFLDGALDEVRLTTGRGLTDEEIAGIYLAGVRDGGRP